MIQIPVSAGAKNTHNDCLLSSVPKANKMAPNMCSRETNEGRMFAIAIKVTCRCEKLGIKKYSCSIFEVGHF